MDAPARNWAERARAAWWRAQARMTRRTARRLEAAALSLLLTTGLLAAYAAYRWFGQDFRGYYAAATLVLRGGNPYDYGQLAPVLLQIDGRMGNNPYYYAPWWSLFFVPFTLLPYPVARAVWLGLNLAAGAAALLVALRVLGWRLKGAARWLVFWSALYLFGWMCLRYEQSGIVLFASLVVAVWALQRGRDRTAGAAMALLLTKPNATFLPLAVLAAYCWFRGRRQALGWAAGAAAGLLLISTLAIPGWYKPILAGQLPDGLTRVLDGPQNVVGVRINTTLLHWLEPAGIRGPAAWIAWAAAAVLALILLVRAWRRHAPVVYLAALATGLGFVVTPYALQYDYPALALLLLWMYQHIPRSPAWKVAIAVTALAFLYSLLFWEGRISDGFWLPLLLSGLLLLFPPPLAGGPTDAQPAAA